jgi:AcrR family transcriptional regulator
MRELALRAGLSEATPYNLFGTKTEILRAVYLDQASDLQGSFIAFQCKGGFETVMQTVDNIVSLIVNNAKFYRSLAKALSNVDPLDIRSEFVPNTDKIFLPLVEKLIQDRQLVTKISPNLIGLALMRIFLANFVQWASYQWEPRYFLKQLKIGFAFCMLGLAKGKNHKAFLNFLEVSMAEKPEFDSIVGGPRGMS